MTSAVESTGATAAPGVPGPALARLSEMPRVDLMPAEIAAAAAFRRLQGGLALALIASAAIVGGLYYQGHSSVNHAKSKLTVADEKQQAMQVRVDHLSYVTAEYTDVANAKSQIQAALGGEVLWSQKLNDLSLSMPANVWLTSMTVTPGASSSSASGIASISFAGVAELTPGATGECLPATAAGACARNNVATWLDSLAAEKGYIDPYVSTTPESVIGDHEVVTFTSTVTVTSASLSARYFAPNGV